MITLDGDNIIETTETIMSVKELRAKKKAINEEIDAVKLEPDELVILNDNKQRLEVLRAEKQKIIDLLNSVNLT